MNIFENWETSDHHLVLSFKYLISTHPTSIEIERACLAASYIEQFNRKPK